jgi:hypothetical protein
MEVLDSYEFDFSEMVNKCGGIAPLIDKLDAETLHDIEVLIRDRRPWKKDEMAKILDDIAYNEYMMYLLKSNMEVTSKSKKSLEYLPIRHIRDNIYIKIYETTTSHKDTDDFVQSLIDSGFPRQCLTYIVNGGRNTMVNKIDNHFKEIIKEKDYDLDVVKYMAIKFKEVGCLERVYHSTKLEGDLWRLVEKYHKDGDITKALAMRPFKCVITVTGHSVNDLSKAIVGKYPTAVVYASLDTDTRTTKVKVYNMDNGHTYHSHVVGGGLNAADINIILDDLDKYRVYFV